MFKTVVGVTPKQYATTHRTERFRAGLTADASVTEAIYDAGFGSASRAYESLPDSLGMTPSAYRNGGAGLEIRIAVGRCFLGWILVAATEIGICAMEFGDDPEIMKDQFRSRFSNAHIVDEDPEFRDWLDEVLNFIETPEIGLDLPLDIQGTAFQRRVWDALRQVSAGTTVSYRELADRIGSPNSARAVAKACATNRVPVAIPCHRVVRQDGGLGGYKWGIERKQALLDRGA
jgi:AraC family transcriptional regulator of adaptative response/methylated-DNA-[protein]-cysteine methyltransferase